MNFKLPDELEMLKQTLRSFVEKECMPLERELCYSDPDWEELPENEMKRLQDLVKKHGLWAMFAPEEYGGGGIGPLGMVVATEEISKSTIGTAHRNPFGGNPPGILYKCKGEQIDKYLLPVIRGEKRTAMCQTEPDAGSDAAAIRTLAVKDGDNWIINGRKLFSTLADRAEFCFVTTITDKEKGGRGGITMFMVDTDTPGFSVERVVRVMRPQHSTEVVLDNVVVPSSNILGEVGEGFKLFREWASYNRLKLAASCVGRAQRALDMTIKHAKQRVTFGKPLATRQAVQWMIVDAALEIRLARLLTFEIAWKLEQGMDVTEEASFAKLYGTEMAFRVLDKAIQIHGGLGLCKELPLERWFREVRVMRIVEGASEIQRFILSRYLLR
jgi:acyl-CoA dehydrogenase